LGLLSSYPRNDHPVLISSFEEATRLAQKNLKRFLKEKLKTMKESIKNAMNITVKEIKAK